MYNQLSPLFVPNYDKRGIVTVVQMIDRCKGNHYHLKITNDTSDDGTVDTDLVYASKDSRRSQHLLDPLTQKIMIRIRVNNPQNVEMLQQIDEAIKEGAVTHSIHWFGELKNHQEIEEIYVPLIRTQHPAGFDVTISVTECTCFECISVRYPHSINELNTSILKESSILPFVVVRDIWIKRDPMCKGTVVAFGSSLWTERAMYKRHIPQFVL